MISIGRILVDSHDIRAPSSPHPTRVAFCQRQPFPNVNFSVERVFADVRSHLPRDIEGTQVTSPFRSKGITRRLLNVIAVLFYARRDVYHVTGDITYISLLLPKRSTVITFLDCVSLNRIKGLRYILFKWIWYSIPISRARYITCISDATRQEICNRFPYLKSMITTIPCPVSDIFQYSPYSLRAKAPVILQMGTGPTKNIGTLAEALRGVDCHLRVVGLLKPDQEISLQANGVKYSSVFGISDEQVADEYKSCDLVIFVSTYEGFGLPILEAQATGRPVITSTTSSMPEVAGAGACFVDPRNAQEIREGILRVLREADYRNHLIEMGLENVQQFSASKIAAEYAQLYRHIHRGSHRRTR